MENNIFDYSWHYSKWHTDTEQSKSNDINYAKWLYQTQGIYPPPPLSLDNNIKVLEIGCGMGRFLLHLKEMGYSNLVGVDIDEGQYRIAKKEGLNVFLSDAKTFLLKDTAKYHAVYAFDVLEHIEKSEQLELLKLIFNRLDDNGMLVIQVPNALAPTATYFRYIDFTHTISYTEDSLAFLLHNAGFHDFCIRPTHNESQEVQNLKLAWARLYRHEFGLKNIILTPNIIAIVFKNKESYQSWQEKAPIIDNPYQDNIAKSNTIKHRIKKILRKLYKRT